MRRAIEFLLTRGLRSRLGIAVIVAVVILGIVGAARLVSGPLDAENGIGNRPSGPITTVDPTSGNDGLLSSGPPPSPVTSPGALKPEQAADNFVAAWLAGRHQSDERWHTELQPFSTPSLTEKLAGVDPASVPAERVTGETTLRLRTEHFVEVLIPVDTGRLRLELVVTEGRWLVDAVDWEQA